MVTKLIGSITFNLSNASIDLDELKVEIKELERQRDKIFECDDLIQNNLNEDDLVEDMAEASDISLKIGKVLLQAANVIADITSFRRRAHANIPASDEKNVKLPQIQLPFFDGNPIEWLEFWDCFESAVHSRDDISSAHKFNYLKGQLKAEAAQLIEGFTLTNQHYSEAVDLLKETYGKPNKIITSHLNALFDLQCHSSQPNGLMQFRAQYECHLRGLRALSANIDDSSYVFAALLIKKLPPKTRDNLNRAWKNDIWDLNSFKKALNAEIEYLQAVDLKESHASVNKDYIKGKVTVNKNVRYDKYSSIETKPLTPTVSNFNMNVSSSTSKAMKNVPQKYFKPKVCKYCSNAHYSAECSVYIDRASRLSRASELKLCTNCLNEHPVEKCTSKFCCLICKSKHHTSLCKDTNKANRDTVNSSTIAYQVADIKGVALLTALIPVLNSGVYNSVRALFDQCAQRTLILRSVVDRLRLPIKRTDYLSIDGFGSEGTGRTYNVIEVMVQTELEIITMEAIVVDKLPSKINVPGLLKTVSKLHLKGIKLADPNIDDDCVKDVSILIGADYYYEFIKGHSMVDNVHLLKSSVGHLISGRLNFLDNEDLCNNYSAMFLHILSDSDENTIRKDFERLWSFDAIGITPEKDVNHYKVVKYFEHTIEKREGKYVTRLPWKRNHPRLPTNYGMVRNMLEATRNRLAEQPDKLKLYHEIFMEYEQRGFIEKVPYSELRNDSDKIHYLPHHGVTKNSPTTPLRIVFNCSAGQPSLNDCLYTGPSLVTDIVHILLRFRLKSYACCSDIAKAFLMVSLHESDRDCTRFLWFEDPCNPNSKVITYRFNVVLFGATCSQFLLNATIIHHLKGINNDIAHKIMRNIYIDNMYACFDREAEIVNFYEKAKTIMNYANFTLREWNTNSLALSSIASLNGDSSQDERKANVLGLTWLKDLDSLTYAPGEFPQGNCTKRLVLSQASKIYDPLGYLSPVTIKSKIFLQYLWKKNLTWDEILQESDEREWRNISQDLSHVLQLQIPRVVIKSESVTLHAFSDASTVAYGMSVYLCDDKFCNLATAKSRVAPMKPLTMPQMELVAATLCARLVNQVLEAYSQELIIESVYSQLKNSWPLQSCHFLCFEAIWHRRALETSLSQQWAELRTPYNF